MALTKTPIELSSTPSIVDGGNATAITIDSSEQVGIGTANPQSLLHLSATAPIISLTDTNSFTDANDRLIFRAGTDEGLIQWYDDSASSTSTIATFESGGNVGINTSSPSTLLHLGGTAPGDSIIRQDSTSSGTNWEIGERAAGKWQIFEDDGDKIVATFNSTGYVEMASASQVRLTLGSQGTAGTNTANWVRANGSELGFNSASGGFHWEIGGTERMRVLSSGGLTFNGDTATANALDDYEEGTWTPANNGTAFSEAYGSYTKIGNRVFCQLDVTQGSGGASAGDWSGLPFTIRNSTTLGRGGGSVAYHNAAAGESYQISTENVNSTTFSIRSGSTQKQLAAGQRLWGSFNYLV